MNQRVSLHRDEPLQLDSELWVVAVVFFGIGDLATTSIGLNIAGVVEVGPVVASLTQQHGVGAVVVLKLALFCAGYLAWKSTPRPQRVGVPLGLSLLGLVVTAWNVRVLMIALPA